MKLTVLGCGDAFGNGGRNNTSFLLTHDDEHILLDCGATTLVRLKSEQISLDNISTIIISHFHGDHFGGVPFIIISSLFENQRSRDLTIVGPVGVEQRVLNLLDAMYPDTIQKLGLFRLKFVELNASQTLVNGIQIVGLPVDHSPPSNPHGIRLVWKDKTIAFSGDTSWTDNLIELSDDADLFICECNFLNNQAFGHLSYRELLEKRTSLNCQNIWLSHMGNEVLTDNQSAFNKLDDGMKIEF